MGSGDLGGGGAEFWRAEAERLAADNVALRAQVAELEDQIGALAEKVSVLAKLAFGTSSEKAARPAVDTGAGDPGDGAKRGRGQQRGSRGHGRRDYSHLPTHEEIHDVPEAERVLPALRRRLCAIRRTVLRAARLAGVADPHRAPPPDLPAHLPLPGPRGPGRPAGSQGDRQGPVHHGVCGPAAGEKFVLGRPAHRIVAALAHDGLDLAEGTLAGVFAACSDLLAPLADKISERNAAGWASACGRDRAPRGAV